MDIENMDVASLKALRDKVDAALSTRPTESLSEAIDECQSFKDRATTTGKSVISRAIKMFIEKYPSVDSLRWLQYTPYFCDGDACEFGISSLRVKFVDGPEDGGDYEDGYLDSWHITWLGKDRPSLVADLDDLGNLLTLCDETLKAIFGDHAQVTVRRDRDAEVVQYDHD